MFIVPWHAGLTALRAAIVSGPANTTVAVNATWSSSRATPCHDIDPGCIQCTLPNVCGAQVPVNGTGPPKFFCYAAFVGCRHGRVTNISLAGVVLRELPAQVNRLSWLQELGKQWEWIKLPCRCLLYYAATQICALVALHPLNSTCHMA
jgi:hypothetical protein